MDINDYSPDEVVRLWELYCIDCTAHRTTPSVRDYAVWLNDEGYVD